MAGFDFKIPSMNMFQQPVPQVGTIGPRSTEQVGGTRQAGGTYGAPGAAGGSAVDRELADMRRFIPEYNGTGELQPNNAENGAKLQMLYA